MKPLSFLLFSLPLALTTPISKRLFDSPVRNDLLNGTPCRAITIIFARGTLEEGNVGTFAGPPFFDAVADAVGAQNVDVQGVSLQFSSILTKSCLTLSRLITRPTSPASSLVVIEAAPNAWLSWCSWQRGSAPAPVSFSLGIVKVGNWPRMPPSSFPLQVGLRVLVVLW